MQREWGSGEKCISKKKCSDRKSEVKGKEKGKKGKEVGRKDMRHFKWKER